MRYSVAGTRIAIIRVIPYNKSQPDGWFKTLPTTYWGDGRQPNNAQLCKYAKLMKLAYVNLLCELLKTQSVHLKWVNSIACKLYFSNALGAEVGGRLPVLLPI